MMNLDFRDYLALSEARNVIFEVDLHLSLYNFDDLFDEAKRQVLNPTRTQQRHIDPMTGRGWRGGLENAYRQMRAIAKDEMQKGTPLGDLFVSFSNTTRFGVLPRKTDHGAPHGIFCYPLRYVLHNMVNYGKEFGVPYGSGRYYMHVFKVKPKKKRKHGDVLNIGTPRTKEDRARWREFSKGKAISSSRWHPNAVEVDVDKLLEVLRGVDFPKALEAQKEKVQKWIEKFFGVPYDRYAEAFDVRRALKGFRESTRKRYVRHLVQNFNNLVETVINRWPYLEGNMEEKIKKTLEEFPGHVENFLNRVEEGPTQRMGDRFETMSVEQFLKGINYYGEYYPDDYSHNRMFSKIDLEAGEVYFSDMAKQSWTDPPMPEKMSIEELFKAEPWDSYNYTGNRWKRNELRKYSQAMLDKWNTRNEPPEEKEGESEEEKIKKHPVLKKAMEKTADFLKKAIISFSKNYEKSKQRIKFPFSEQIKKVAEKYGLDWVKSVKEAAESRASKNAAGFIYQLTRMLAAQMPGNTYMKWSQLLKQMGFIGAMDAFNTGTIYSGEDTQGFFIHAGDLELLHTVEKETHSNIQRDPGTPNIKLSQLRDEWRRAKKMEEYRRRLGELERPNYTDPNSYQRFADAKKELWDELSATWDQAYADWYTLEDFAREKFLRDNGEDPKGKVPDHLQKTWRKWVNRYKTETPFERTRHDYVRQRDKQRVGSQQVPVEDQTISYFTRTARAIGNQIQQLARFIERALETGSYEVGKGAQPDPEANWHNQLADHAGKMLALLKSYYPVKAAWGKNSAAAKQKYGHVPGAKWGDVDDTFRITDSHVREMVQNLKEFVASPANQRMFKVLWRDIFKRVSDLINMGEYVLGEGPAAKVSRYGKATPVMSRGKEREFFRVWYPGEDKLHGKVSEDLYNKSADQITFPEVVRHTKEQWQQILDYQVGKGMISPMKAEKLAPKFDWYYEDEYYKKHSYSSLYNIDLMYEGLGTLSKIAPTEEELDKAIKLQTEMGKSVDVNSVKERYKEGMAKLSELQNDPDFKKIPAEVLDTVMWRHNWKTLLPIGVKGLEKLLEYKQIIGEISSTDAENYKESYLGYFKIIEDLGVPADKAVLVFETDWHYMNLSSMLNMNLKKEDLPLIEKILAYKREKGDISSQSQEAALNAIKFVFKHGMERPEPPKKWKKMPYWMRDPDYNGPQNKEEVEQFFDTRTEFEDFINYMLHRGLRFNKFNRWMEHGRHLPQPTKKSKFTGAKEFKSFSDFIAAREKGETQKSKTDSAPEIGEPSDSELEEYLRNDESWYDKAREEFWDSSTYLDGRPVYTDIDDWIYENDEPTDVDDWEYDNPEPDRDDVAKEMYNDEFGYDPDDWDEDDEDEANANPDTWMDEHDDDIQAEFDSRWESWDSDRDEIKDAHDTWEREKDEIESQIYDWENGGEDELFDQWISDEFLDEYRDEIRDDWIAMRKEELAEA